MAHEFQCQICQVSVPKNEVMFLDETTFSFLPAPPSGLKLGSYCPPCFDAHVGPELDRYNSKLELAKNVNVFYASQSKESRFVRRIEKPIKVENCQDQDDVVLRLAFLAVEAGKNSIVDVDVKSAKVRNFSYQTSVWQGRAIPADIDERSLQRRFPGTPN